MSVIRPLSFSAHGLWNGTAKVFRTGLTAAEDVYIALSTPKTNTLRQTYTPHSGRHLKHASLRNNTLFPRTPRNFKHRLPNNLLMDHLQMRLGQAKSIFSNLFFQPRPQLYSVGLTDTNLRKAGFSNLAGKTLRNPAQRLDFEHRSPNRDLITPPLRRTLSVDSNSTTSTLSEDFTPSWPSNRQSLSLTRNSSNASSSNFSIQAGTSQPKAQPQRYKFRASLRDESPSSSSSFVTERPRSHPLTSSPSTSLSTSRTTSSADSLIAKSPPAQIAAARAMGILSPKPLNTISLERPQIHRPITEVSGPISRLSERTDSTSLGSRGSWKPSQVGMSERGFRSQTPQTPKSILKSKAQSVDTDTVDTTIASSSSTSTPQRSVSIDSTSAASTKPKRKTLVSFEEPTIHEYEYYPDTPTRSLSSASSDIEESAQPIIEAPRHRMAISSFRETTSSGIAESSKPRNEASRHRMAKSTLRERPLSTASSERSRTHQPSPEASDRKLKTTLRDKQSSTASSDIPQKPQANISVPRSPRGSMTLREKPLSSASSSIVDVPQPSRDTSSYRFAKTSFRDTDSGTSTSPNSQKPNRGSLSSRSLRDSALGLNDRREASSQITPPPRSYSPDLDSDDDLLGTVRAPIFSLRKSGAKSSQPALGLSSEIILPPKGVLPAPPRKGARGKSAPMSMSKRSFRTEVET